MQTPNEIHVRRNDNRHDRRTDNVHIEFEIINIAILEVFCDCDNAFSFFFTFIQN